MGETEKAHCGTAAPSSSTDGQAQASRCRMPQACFKPPVIAEARTSPYEDMPLRAFKHSRLDILFSTQRRSDKSGAPGVTTPPLPVTTNDVVSPLHREASQDGQALGWPTKVPGERVGSCRWAPFSLQILGFKLQCSTGGALILSVIPALARLPPPSPR